jgi:hypothetical protein
MDWEFYETHFATSRMATYFQVCQGDTAKAASLYEWNTQVSSAFWELLAYLEVSLRNTIDRQMQRRREEDEDPEHWLVSKTLGFASVNQHFNKELTEAKRRVALNNKELSGEQMLSELSFSFWTSMVANRTKRYWPDIAKGFSGLPSRKPNELSILLAEIRVFRNRIGHHHRIWHLDLEQMHQKILLVAQFINPEFCLWLSSKSRIDELLRVRPD